MPWFLQGAPRTSSTTLCCFQDHTSLLSAFCSILNGSWTTVFHTINVMSLSFNFFRSTRDKNINKTYRVSVPYLMCYNKRCVIPHCSQKRITLSCRIHSLPPNAQTPHNCTSVKSFEIVPRRVYTLSYTDV